MKTEEKYNTAYTEVMEVLKYISLEDYNKIPSQYIRFMEENADEECSFEYNIALPFEKQEISEEAKDVLAMLFRLFIIDEKEKERLSIQDAKEYEK